MFTLQDCDLLVTDIDWLISVDPECRVQFGLRSA